MTSRHLCSNPAVGKVHKTGRTSPTCLEHVGPLYTNFAPAVAGEVLHVRTVHQLDQVTGQRWRDVAGLEVARQGETAGGGALRQPVTLQHGTARSDKLVPSL